jgi:hypothetical protein
MVLVTVSLTLGWSSQEDEFISGFRKAHEKKDIEAISRLIYWNGVEPDRKELQLKDISVKLPLTITSAEIIEPKNKTREFKRQGKVYRPNLKVVKELLIKYAPQTGPVRFTESTYPLGKLNGNYIITVSVPAQ